MAKSRKTLFGAATEDATLQALASVRSVKITGANGIAYDGNLRLAGAAVPALHVPGPVWRYSLVPGVYLFNVNIAGVAGVTVNFTVTGATASPPSTFLMAGAPGVVVGQNEEIEIVVA